IPRRLHRGGDARARLQNRDAGRDGACRVRERGDRARGCWRAQDGSCPAADYGSGTARIRKDEVMNHNEEERCQGYLELLEVYLRRGLQIRSFIRMCVSNWYAFHCGEK